MAAAVHAGARAARDNAHLMNRLMCVATYTIATDVLVNGSVLYEIM